jgi:hypothetical protein
VRREARGREGRQSAAALRYCCAILFFKVSEFQQLPHGAITPQYQNVSQRNLGYYELNTPKPWFYERCSELLDQKKEVKLQWLKNPNEINGDNLNNKA